ncbi:MAG: Ig-like domain-containing protein, partial [Sulfuricurvum sp.]|nr:Ig-like domain-containing protein [Sulfuricurvum sp.]
VAVVSGAANATAAEATAGAVTVSAENGSSLAVTFTNGIHSVTKTVTATGSAQTIALASGDLTTLGDGTISVSAVATDTAGNPSTAGTGSFVLDTVTPVVASSGAVSAHDSNNDSTYNVTDTITIRFSEAVDVSKVTLANITPSNSHNFGTGAAIAADNASNGFASSFTITLGTGSTIAGSDTLTIAPANIVDTAGNAAVASAVFTLPATIGAPTIAIAATLAVDNIVNATEDNSVTISGTTDAENGQTVTVHLSDAGSAHTVTTTATALGGAWTAAAADISAFTNGNITVTADVTNLAGNPAIQATKNITLDNVAPTVTSVIDNVGGVANAATATIAYTYTFSEAVTGLTAVDFTATNGTVSSVTGSGTTWTVNVTPTSGVASGNISLALAAGAVTDTALNPNAANTNNAQAIDTLAPTLTSSSPADNANPVPINSNIVLTFGENVTAAATGNIVISNGSDTRTIAASDTTQVSINGGIVTINPTTNLNSSSAYNVLIDSGALIDSAGNPYAGISNPTALNFTTAAPDITPPVLLDTSFVPGSNTVLSLKFSENVMLGSGGTPTVLLNGTTDIMSMGTPSIVGDTITVTFTGVTTTSSDYILISAPTNSITDLAGNSAASAVIVAASNNNSTIDLSTLQAILPLQYSGMIVYGSTGDDTITGTNNMEYIIGGEGKDIINTGWGNDVIDLSETAPAQDIVMVASNNGGNSGLSSPDTVYYFDTTSATVANHDALGFATAQIAINKAAAAVGAPVGPDQIDSYSIANGIISFYTNPGSTFIPVTINSNNLTDAITLIKNSAYAVGDITGIKFDSDNNGSVDSLLVFQKGDNNNVDELLIALASLSNIGTVQLGTSAGANVVQIVDKIGPNINGVSFLNNHQLTLSASEIVASTTLTDAANTQMYIGTGSTLGTGFDASITGTNSAALTIDTSTHTFTTSQYIVVANTGNPTLTDAAGNHTNMFDTVGGGFVLGNTATASIDISTALPTGDYTIFNMLTGVNSTLVGNGGNNNIEGGGYNDTITGGAGADQMRGNGGHDTFIFHAGDSTAVVWHNTNTAAGLNNGDTFTFANGADTIDMWNLMSGDKSTMVLDAGLTLGTLNSSNGTVGDNQYALVNGWFDYASNVFNVQSTGGNATMVVYDGNNAVGTTTQTAFVMTNVNSMITFDTSVAHTISYTVI